MRHTDEQIRQALDLARLTDVGTLRVLADTVEDYRPIADAYITCRQQQIRAEADASFQREQANIGGRLLDEARDERDTAVERAERAENALLVLHGERQRGSGGTPPDDVRDAYALLDALQDTKEPRMTPRDTAPDGESHRKETETSAA